MLDRSSGTSRLAEASARGVQTMVLRAADGLSPRVGAPSHLPPREAAMPERDTLRHRAPAELWGAMCPRYPGL
jgi:hypothetical protein